MVCVCVYVGGWVGGWKVEFLKCSFFPLLPVPFSPVQSARKFSTVLGTCGRVCACVGCSVPLLVCVCVCVCEVWVGRWVGVGVGACWCECVCVYVCLSRCVCAVCVCACVFARACMC